MLHDSLVLNCTTWPSSILRDIPHGQVVKLVKNQKINFLSDLPIWDHAILPGWNKSVIGCQSQVRAKRARYILVASEAARSAAERA